MDFTFVLVGPMNSRAEKFMLLHGKLHDQRLITDMIEIGINVDMENFKCFKNTHELEMETKSLRQTSNENLILKPDEVKPTGQLLCETGTTGIFSLEPSHVDSLGLEQSEATQIVPIDQNRELKTSDVFDDQISSGGLF